MKFRTELTLDALTDTYDPDVGDKDSDKSGIEFRWLCRRTCESFPPYHVADGDIVITEEGQPCPTHNYTFQLDVGCFWNDTYNATGYNIFFIKGVMTWSMVDALSELCSPFLKGGNSAFIAAIASGLFVHKPNIGHSDNYGPNRNKMGSNY